MAQKSMKKLVLSLSIAAALGCVTGSAFADGDSTEALEARIAELEALVHKLVTEEQTDECCVDVDQVSADAAAAAEAKAMAVLADHKAGVAETEHAHSYKFGGYIKLDAMYSDYDPGPYTGQGRDFYYPSTVPVGSGDSEAYLDFHAKESRINFKSTHNLDNGAKMSTFFEMDFHGSTQGNEAVSNSYSPRVRHAFFTYNKWLFGQTWFTFFNVGALPENLDFIGPGESTVFGRQAMIRYTNGPWMFAAENGNSLVMNNGGASRGLADDNKLPDLVGRYNMSGDWGSLTVAGILRQLRCDGCATGVKDTETGYGISVSGKFMLGKDDFRWMANVGSGLGRYVGVAAASDAVIDDNGNLEAIDSWSAFGSFRHLWNDQWRSNFTLGYLSIDNDVHLTGGNATKEAKSVHVNLIYSPVPKMDFGVELMYADREVESGADGDLTRLQFSAKYAF